MGIIYRFCVILLFVINRKATCDVYTSIAVLEDVIKIETKFIRTIEEYISSENERLDRLNRYVESYQKQNNLALKNIEDYLENPLNVYLLIKRLTVGLQLIENSISMNNVHKVFSNIKEYKNETNFPTMEDLYGTIAALSVIQQVYKLDTRAFASGQLGKIKYDTELNPWDCIQFGNHYYEKRYFNYSKSWFEEGKHRLVRHSNDFIQSNVNMQYAQSRIKEMDELFSKNNSLIDNEDGYTKLFREHCNTGMNPPIEVLSKLKCKYVTNSKPFLRIAPFKVEELSMKPKIYRFYNVMSDDEIETLKRLTFSRFETAQVYINGSENVVDSSRIGKIAWLPHSTHECVTKINKRISDMSGLTYRTAEPLQTCNYGVGGYFFTHWDFVDPERLNTSTVGERGNGNRLATVLFYMNEVSQGGHTAFPEANVTARPIKGSAVMWYNLFPSGDGDYDTTHAACPVLSGTKWVTNKWLYEYGQEFLRPCKLNRAATGYDFIQ